MEFSEGKRGHTAEGLGGTNVQGMDDPKTEADLTYSTSNKPTDPDWVQRKDPESLQPSAIGQEVGFDPGAATVATMEGTDEDQKEQKARSSGASASQTGLLPRSHAMAGPQKDPQALGAVGSDVQAGSGKGVLGAGPRQRDKASAGADYLVTEEGFGKSTKARVRAGTEGGEQGEALQRGFDVSPP